MQRTNTYLLLSRHNIYYFRLTAPRGAPVHLRGREMRRSLQTRDPNRAIRIALPLRNRAEELLLRIVDGDMEWHELKKILDEELNLQLSAFKNDLSRNGPRPTLTESIWENNQIPGYKRKMNDIQAEINHRIKSKKKASWHDIPENVTLMANQILAQSGIEIAPDSMQYLKFCEATMEMYHMQFARALELSRRAREFSITDTQQKSPITPSPSLHIQTDKIADIASKFCEERVQGGNWQKKTEQEHQCIYSLLAKIIGDIPMSLVTHEEARQFKDTLRNLPSNMTKKKKYRNRNIQELIALKIPTEERLSITKINTYLSRVSALFNWAVTHGYTTLNPFKGLGLKEKVLPHEKRMVFDEKDLQKLFTTPVYSDLTFKHSYYYWLPLIGLYSGARIEEICQLYLDDIREKDGIWVFDINVKDGKNLKTKSSQRLIPIHKKLIEAGLFVHVSQLSQQGETRLFPELKKQSDKFSHSASKWFGRYRRKNGVPHKRKTFHSFRHYPEFRIMPSCF